MPIFQPPLNWKKLLLPNRIPYEALPEQKRSEYHQSALRMLGLVYRTEDLPVAVQDFLHWSGLQMDDVQPALLKLLALCKDLKLSDKETRVLLNFTHSVYTVRELKDKEDELLQDTPIIVPSAREGAYKIDIGEVLATLIDKKIDRQARKVDDGVQDEVVLKVAIDAGRVFQGNGKEANMTIGSMEDVDRGKHEHRSRTSAHMFYAQSGTNSS